MELNVRKALTQSDDPRCQRVTFNVDPSDSEELRAIIAHHLPQWADLFARKNAEYQDGNGTAFFLGERGQFSDMYRKMMKLKAAMWDDNEAQLVSEGVDEIIMDLIGHCFLTLEMRRRRMYGNSPLFAEPEVEPMTPEVFKKMVEDAGLFVIDTTAQPADPTFESSVPQGAALDIEPEEPVYQPKRDESVPTEAELEQAWKSFAWNRDSGKALRVKEGQTPWAVGDAVHLKQHLGRGPLLMVLDVREVPTGHNVLVTSAREPQKDGVAVWAHPAWLVAMGKMSTEERVLVQSLAVRRGATQEQLEAMTDLELNAFVNDRPAVRPVADPDDDFNDDEF